VDAPPPPEPPQPPPPQEPSAAQKLTVLLAFTAAALSFSALTVIFLRTGTIQATPLIGGVLMFFLGLAGYSRIRRSKS
jgi:hypothetical protein